MVGARLRRLRVARGLTQKELGAPRYTHAYVSTIEAGRRHPSRDALEHFAAKLGIGVDELVTGRTPDLEARLRLRLQEARVQISDGRLEEADAGLRRVVRDAKRYEIPRLEARAEEVLGLRMERSGKPEEALEHFQRAEDLLHDEPPTARADAVDGKATSFAALGDVRYAIFLLESLLDEIERSGLRDPDALSRIHASLVYWYLDLGLMESAARSARQLERLAVRVDDPRRIAQMHMNVARQLLASGRVGDATTSLQRAEDAYRQLGLLTEMGGAYLARGYVLSRQGSLDQARAELEQARDIFERTENAKDLTRALNELGRVARLEGRPEDARALLFRSIGIIGSSDDPVLAWAHLELGTVLSQIGDADAEKHVRIAIELYERTEQPIGLAVAYRALGDLLHQRGDVAGGGEAYRTGISAVEPLL
ncbi:MAG: tetratricopeptide repeat protein [Actinomycetota bacterium]